MDRYPPSAWCAPGRGDIQSDGAGADARSCGGLAGAGLLGNGHQELHRAHVRTRHGRESSGEKSLHFLPALDRVVVSELDQLVAIAALEEEVAREVRAAAAHGAHASQEGADG